MHCREEQDDEAPLLLTMDFFHCWHAAPTDHLGFVFLGVQLTFPHSGILLWQVAAKPKPIEKAEPMKAIRGICKDGHDRCMSPY